MGLFGGFKGKLIGKQKKPKNDNKQVVCLKFEVYSEFDASPSSQRTQLPSCSNQNPGRNDVIRRQKRPVPKPEIKALWPDSNGEVKSDKTNDDIHIKQNGINPPDFGKIAESTDDGNFDIHIANKSVKWEKVPVQSKKVPDQPKKVPDQPKIVPDQPKKAPDQPKIVDDQRKKGPDQPKKAPDQPKKAPDQPKIVPDQRKKAPDQPKKAPDQPKKAPDLPQKVPDQPQKVPDQPKQVPDQANDTSDDDDYGNFKIHIAQASARLDSESSDEAEDKIDHSPHPMSFGYSSQAESIFFGGEEEPLANRPRNFVFTDDDVDDGGLSDGSSASA